jgi:hypothetical protein
MADSGIDKKTSTTKVGQKVNFSALAYDAAGKSIAAGKFTPIFKSNAPKVFTLDSTTGAGVAIATGSFSVTVSVDGVSTTAGYVASGTATTTTVTTTTTTATSSTAATTPVPAPAPSPAPVGTALSIVRFDGQNGAATVSTGIPLAPGALKPGQENLVRIYVGNVEQAAYVTGLWSRHPDGSLRAVLVQFQVASLPASGATGTLTLGSARPAAMTLAAPIVTPGAPVSGVPNGLPQAAALPTSTSYLLSADLVGTTVTSAATTAQGGVFARYESDFAKFADHYWATEGVDYLQSDYYDRALIYYAMWARTGNPTYWARAGQIAYDYRARYLEPNAYGSSPHWAQLEGLEKHYLLTGDDASRAAVLKTAYVLQLGFLNSNYMTPSAGESRIAARVLHSQLLAWRLAPAGAPTDALVASTSAPSLTFRGANMTAVNWGRNVETALGKIAAWQQADGSYPANAVCGGQLNYMIGLLNDALIKTYDYYVPAATPRAAIQGTVRTLVQKAVDYLWTTQWVASRSAFQYASVDCSSKSVGGMTPSPDLNNMLTAGFGWLLKQTGNTQYRDAGEAIFAGGVTQAYLSGTKQFNENYTSSFRYLGYR